MQTETLHPDQHRNAKPICGAHKRKKDGAICQSTVLYHNGRCKMHGGPTPTGMLNASFKHGHRSKYAYLPAAIQTRAEDMVGDLIENLVESVVIQKTMETLVLEQFSAGVSLEKWAELKGEIAEYRKYLRDGPPEMQLEPAVVIDNLEEIINAGLNDARSQSLLTQRLQSIHDSQRKLTESASKCRKDQQEIYTQEQWNAAWALVIITLREELANDPDAIKRIVTRWAAYRQPTEENVRQIGGRAD